MNFGPHHYVPILKCKRGEKQAVQSVSAAARQRMTPLIEVTEIGQTGRPWARHLETTFRGLPAAFPGGASFFLDVREISSVGQTAPSDVFNRAVAENLSFVPVVGVSRPVHELQAALAHAQRGLCLRLERDELARGDLARRVSTFLSANRLQPGTIDLVMDMGSVEKFIQQAVEQIADDFMTTVPTLPAWRTLTISGTAFPQSMTVVATNSHGLIDRMEWLAWRALHGRRRSISRLPSFGDAVIQHPSGVEGFDPRIHQVSASVRYTTNDQWLLIKGSSTRQTPATLQFPRLAASLVPPGRHSRYFRGVRHCVGCHNIVQAAQRAPRLGSPEAWRRIGTIHHLTSVLEQLAGLPWP